MSAMKVFWRRFRRNNWEKKAAVFRRVPSDIFDIDAKCIFNMLVRYCDHASRSGNYHGLSFYINGVKQPKIKPSHLPKKKDGSLAGYHRRMNRSLKDYCLNLNLLTLVSDPHWKALSEFVLGLYDEVGMPTLHAEISLFLGNYRKTPFGVHRDPIGVFSIPVAGTKKFRVWTPSYVAKNKSLIRAQDYPHHKRGSRLLVARPGAMMYWPSPLWHIAESDGKFSATWSLGVWLDENAPTIRYRRLFDKDGRLSALPRSLTKARNSDQTKRSWITKVSQSGFLTGPRPRKRVRIGKGDEVRGISGSPIVWTVLKSGDLLFACNGISFETPSSPDLIRLLRLLNAGKPYKVQGRKDATLLTALYENHGLTV